MPMTPDELARLAKLEQIVGAGFADAPPTAADLNPDNEIPGSRQYPLLLSLFQIRANALDPFFAEGGTLEQMQGKIAALGGGSVVTPPPVLIPGIFTDELGNIGIGGPPIRDPRNNLPSPNHQLTIHSPGTAGIAFIANESLSDPQRQSPANPGGNPQRKHITVISSDHDGGGPRTANNGVYFGGAAVPGSIAEPWVPDEFRPHSADGLDSRHARSWQTDKAMADPAHPGFFTAENDGAQDLTLDLDRQYYDAEAGGMVRGIVWGMMKPGRMVWLGSSVKNALDTFFAKWKA